MSKEKSRSNRGSKSVIKTSPEPTAPKVSLSPVEMLKPHPNNARKHRRAQISGIAESIGAFQFNTPIVIDGKNQILKGHGTLEAAKYLGYQRVPTIKIEHLTDAQARAYMLADNKLCDRSSWDEPKLALELQELSDLAQDFDITATGFEHPEIDLRIQSLDTDDKDADDDFDTSKKQPVVCLGDLWSLENHKICCGDSRQGDCYSNLLGDQTASAVFTDPPYNVPINGHVRVKSDHGHREFLECSGEKSASEFEEFLSVTFKHMAKWTAAGGIIYSCMDWRHTEAIQVAGRDSNLKLLNLCVWVKTNGGMGSFYRSQHELVFVFGNGNSPHINNIQLGRFGRNRSNVWHCAGANSFSRSRGYDDFDSHPTVKPVRLVAEALTDSTHRGDLILDPFLGSGSTLIAAERTGRKCFGIELDPAHVETAINRWQMLTKKKAVNQNGQTLVELRAHIDPA